MRDLFAGVGKDYLRGLHIQFKDLLNFILIKQENQKQILSYFRRHLIKDCISFYLHRNDFVTIQSGAIWYMFRLWTPSLERFFFLLLNQAPHGVCF